MSEFCGNLFLLKVEDSPGSTTFTEVGVFKETALSINNETVDVTDKSTAPARTLFNCGINSMAITASGNFTANAPLQIIASRSRDGALYNYQLVSDYGDIYEGAFQTVTFDRNGAFNGVEECSISLDSSGVIAYTPAP